MRSSVLALCAALMGLACPAFAQMDNNFSTGGAVKIGTSTTTCNAAAEGAIRYNSAAKCMDFCDGSAWRSFNCGFCPASLTSGLVGYWQFDDGTGSTTAADSSGQGNDGTLTNMTPASDWVAGKLGGELDFDGTDDYVNAGSGASLDDLGPMTLSAWIKPNNAGEGGLGKIINKTVDGTSGAWHLEIDNTAPQANAFAFSKGGTTILDVNSADNSVTYGQWQHILVTWDGSTNAANVHIYKNGSEVSYGSTTNGAGPASDGTLPLIIGNYQTGSATFNGLIDDVRVYNRALSAAEIAALYNGGAGCQ